MQNALINDDLAEYQSRSAAGSRRYGLNQRANDNPILNPLCDAYKPASPVGGWKPPLRDFADDGGFGYRRLSFRRRCRFGCFRGGFYQRWQNINLAMLERLFGSIRVVPQQFENREENSHDLAAQVASFEEFAERHFPCFTDPGTDPFDVNGNGCVVVTDA